MAEYPALPLFTDAYLRDCWHLSDAEHGRYLLLLMLIWQTPGCRIPNEPEWIARHLRRTVSAYAEEIRPLIQEFCTTTGNWITQKRLTREMEFLRKQSKQRSDAAKSRWSKGKPICETDAAPHTSRNAPTPTPTPTISKREAKASLSPADAEFVNFWATYPKRSGDNPKDPARKKFAIAVKAGTDPQVIIAGAARYAAHCLEAHTEPRYIKQAMTWLNQKGWESDYGPKPELNGSREDKQREAQRFLDEFDYNQGEKHDA